MLMEEERFISEANNAAKLSAEIAQFQKDTRQMKTADRSMLQGFSQTDARSTDNSIIID